MLRNLPNNLAAHLSSVYTSATILTNPTSLLIPSRKLSAMFGNNLALEHTAPKEQPLLTNPLSVETKGFNPLSHPLVPILLCFLLFLPRNLLQSLSLGPLAPWPCPQLSTSLWQRLNEFQVTISVKETANRTLLDLSLKLPPFSMNYTREE